MLLCSRPSLRQTCSRTACSADQDKSVTSVFVPHRRTVCTSVYTAHTKDQERRFTNQKCCLGEHRDDLTLQGIISLIGYQKFCCRFRGHRQARVYHFLKTGGRGEGARHQTGPLWPRVPLTKTWEGPSQTLERPWQRCDGPSGLVYTPSRPVPR